MPGPTIAVLGALSEDNTIIMESQPEEGETVFASSYRVQMGGKGANAAVAVHRLTRCNPEGSDISNTDPTREDIQLRLVSAVGDDYLGKKLTDELKECGINVDGVKVFPGEVTSTSTMLVEKNETTETDAKRIVLFPGAGNALRPDDFLTKESLGGDVAPNFLIAQLELPRDVIEQAIETAYREGIEVILNQAPARYIMREYYHMIQHLIMSERGAKTLSKDETLDTLQDEIRWDNTVEYFHSLGVENVVITLGERGAYYSRKGGDHASVEAETDCNVVDTSGAGCVFSLTNIIFSY